MAPNLIRLILKCSVFAQLADFILRWVDRLIGTKSTDSQKCKNAHEMGRRGSKITFNHGVLHHFSSPASWWRRFWSKPLFLTNYENLFFPIFSIFLMFVPICLGSLAGIIVCWMWVNTGPITDFMAWLALDSLRELFGKHPNRLLSCPMGFLDYIGDIKMEPHKNVTS